MNILVCYDGSPAAKMALETGIKIGKALDAEIHIFKSVSPEGDSKEVFEFIKSEVEKEIENSKAQLEEACQIADKFGVECKTHISKYGKTPSEDIIDFAKEIEAEYILIGIRKLSRVGKLLFGSTAQYVILNSPCPVMTVRS